MSHSNRFLDGSFTTKHWVSIAALVVVATFLRVGALSTTIVDSPIRADARDYFFYGYNIQQHGVYSSSSEGFLNPKAALEPDAVRSPGYGVFIAAFLGRINEDSSSVVEAALKPVFLAQTAVSIGSVLLVFFMGMRFLPLWGVNVAAFLAAISPHLVNANVYLLSETLFGFLLLLSLYLLILPPKIMRFTLAGVMMAAAALTRPTMEYFPWFFVILMPWVVGRSQWRSGFAFLLTFFAGMLLWKIRNMMAIGSTSDPQLLANTLHHGMYPDFMYQADVESLGMPYRYDPDLAPGEKNIGLVLSVLWQRFQEAPGAYLYWYLIGKPLALFTWTTLPIGEAGGDMLTKGDIYLYPTPITPYADNLAFILTYIVSYKLHVITLLGALATGFYVWLKTHEQKWIVLRLLSFVMVYVVGLHMLGAPFPRYAIPFFPLVYLLFAGGLWVVWQQDFLQKIRSKIVGKRG